jgi:DNA-binding response OmpR family regulator
MIPVLLVEDQITLGESLARHLANEGFQVTLAPTLAAGRERWREKPVLVLIDWMLPDGQGLDLLKEIRLENDRTPVLMLTARTDLVDRVVGLESGANDYITKPFEPRELAARLRAHLRAAIPRKPPAEDEPASSVHCGGISIDERTREVRFRGQSVPLTRMEFELLRLLVTHPNRVFPRESLLNKVWGYDNYPTTRTVDNHIAQLRHKFDPELFETVRGVGYRFHLKTSPNTQPRESTP